MSWPRPLVAEKGRTIVRDGWVCCAICGVRIHNGYGLCTFVHSKECRALRDAQDELMYAEMEAALSESREAYFEARPHLDQTGNRDMFDVGFERAFKNIWRPADGDLLIESEPRDSLADAYLAGVELRRGRLGDQERQEVLGAWNAGFKATELTIPKRSANEEDHK